MGQIGSETTTLMKEKCEPKPLSITEIAHGLVGGDRQSDYGHPLDNWCMVAAIGSVILGKKITFKEALLFMSAAVKTSRELNKEKRDNTIDGCGYLECLDMCYTERDRRIKEGWSFEEVTGKWIKPIFDLAKAMEEVRTARSPFDLPHPLTIPDGFGPLPYFGDPPPGTLPQVICQGNT